MEDESSDHSKRCTMGILLLALTAITILLLIALGIFTLLAARSLAIFIIGAFVFSA